MVDEGRVSKVNAAMNEESENDERFPKERRLRSKADFENVYSGDVFATDETLVIRGVLNELGFARIGISVSRKYGDAHVRNYWKRIIRESFRQSYRKIDLNLDFVVRPRKGAQPNFHAVKKSLPALAAKIYRRLKKKMS